MPPLRRNILSRYCVLLLSVSAAGAEFVNFETAPAHPVELSPNGDTLAVCHLAENRLLLFDVKSGVPQLLKSIRVGHDPSSVRFRTASEVWVVNHISSNLNVVDAVTGHILAIIPTKPGPSDLVFAGTPLRAYVSCTRANVVQVFDPVTRTLDAEVPVAGERPKALAVGPDGTTVYAAILESGNATTIIAPELTHILTAPPPSALSDPDGPYAGLDPPPNSGNEFAPPLNSYLPAKLRPKGSLIVRKNDAGRWMDDNSHDWTEYISGSKAARTGRVAGWDMPDRDLAMIDTNTNAVSYATGLMNICMAVGVNPANGKIAVIGTEAMNHIRFEPRLKSVFLRVNIALVDPATLATSVRDLNPHLDYSARSVPQATRDLSIGDPRGIIWNAGGTLGYVSGMGSRNLIVIDGDGQRVQAAPVELGEGPTGMALDESRNRIYVYNRFAGSISVVDTTSLVVDTTIPLRDTTPEFIRAGRRLFFDTRNTSGLGHVSCASCHIDVRFDRLAWDLGVPDGEMESIRDVDDGIPFAHPMKGPMVTMTLQSFLEAGAPFHWRGDRNSLTAFDVTFVDLLGMERMPTLPEMNRLTRYLTSVRFPPNPLRTIENRLPELLPLPGQNDPDGVPLPPGNAENGRELFGTPRLDLAPPLRFGNSCGTCHDFGSGRGFDFKAFAFPRNDDVVFRSPPLRSVGEKLGFDLKSTESRAGFGFFHDGRVDSLSRLLAIGFNVSEPQDIADLIAFLISLPGGGLPSDADGGHSVSDPPAMLGKQVRATDDNLAPLLATMLSLAGGFPGYNQHEIIAWQRNALEERSWFYDYSSQRFLESERSTDRFTADQILALATPANPVLFMAVSYDTGRQSSIDFDGDGIGNLVELAQGSDPLDRASPTLPPVRDGGHMYHHVDVHPGETVDRLIDASLFPNAEGHPIAFALTSAATAPPGVTLSPEGRLQWLTPGDTRYASWEAQFTMQVLDQPGITLHGTFIFNLAPMRLRLEGISDNSFEGESPEQVNVKWDAFPDYTYEVQTSDDGVTWKRAVRRPAFGTGTFTDWALGIRPQRFYRVLAIDD